MGGWPLVLLLLLVLRGHAPMGQRDGLVLWLARSSPGPEDRLPTRLVRGRRDGRLGAIFAHTSPENRAAIGPLESYAALLASSRYAPLAGFSAVQSIRRLQPSASSYMEVVRVSPAGVCVCCVLCVRGRGTLSCVLCCLRACGQQGRGCRRHMT